jgi:hypothetical protein
VDCGLIFGKVKGLFVMLAGIIGLELFSNGKSCGLGSPTHGPVEALAHGEPRIEGGSGGSPELLLPADSGHGGLMKDGEMEEGATGTWFCLLPRLGRRRGGGAPAVVPQLHAAAVWA